ncbi:NlpC/P60 family protein [Skermania piniformis]|uniref:C40 family peptidase n=1 Tax=Skermania pinensis TaxID=39122 RepID=A0ABX8SHA6_9ACTN|nr:NlpC/P60 family protein [Skermania piniformis]QXQ15061.1 C40 family peptidase [Skermania piniformis]
MTRASRLRPGRALGRSSVAVGLLGAALAAGPATAQPATDQPAALGTPSEAVQQLIDLSHQSEQTNQATLGAQADLDTKLAARHTAEAAAAVDRQALDAAKTTLAQYQPEIDAIASATYRGARTGRLFAVVLSDSPQQLLDQMSAMDALAAQTTVKVSGFKRAADAAAAADVTARASADSARTAADQAAAVRADLTRRQTELQGRIADVTTAWARLSAADKQSLAGSPLPAGFDRDAVLRGLTPGSPIAALAAGMTRIGDPYVWGGNQPGGFDCSGLVQWAFKQVGKDLPRTSEAQSLGGTPVARDDMQVGDVVTFYDDASHVGIYAGNGMILHASTFGVPVAIAPIGNQPFHNARRY